MSNLTKLIEDIENRISLEEYNMPDDERAEYQGKIEQMGLNRKHADALIYLVRGKHINSPRKACNARECEGVVGKAPISDLMKLGLVKSAMNGRTRGYYTSMDGYLIGNGLIRRQLKV